MQIWQHVSYGEMRENVCTGLASRAKSASAAAPYASTIAGCKRDTAACNCGRDFTLGLVWLVDHQLSALQEYARPHSSAASLVNELPCSSDAVVILKTGSICQAPSQKQHEQDNDSCIS